MFRVVRYLPQRLAQRDIDDDLTAGVAQAPREETAEYTTVGVQGTRAMGIVVSARWSMLARDRCTQALDG
jgi:hypothetical protein